MGLPKLSQKHIQITRKWKLCWKKKWSWILYNWLFWSPKGIKSLQKKVFDKGWSSPSCQVLKLTCQSRLASITYQYCIKNTGLGQSAMWHNIFMLFYLFVQDSIIQYVVLQSLSLNIKATYLVLQERTQMKIKTSDSPSQGLNTILAGGLICLRTGLLQAGMLTGWEASQEEPEGVQQWQKYTGIYYLEEKQNIYPNSTGRVAEQPDLTEAALWAVRWTRQSPEILFRFNYSMSPWTQAEQQKTKGNRAISSNTYCQDTCKEGPQIFLSINRGSTQAQHHKLS